ncbi:MAG: hypothetical protein RLZZ303_1707 [Candidatus Hydrogenedentota bacterium]
MPIFVKDIMASMEAWAPASLAYDWDRVGLHTGDPAAPVERVLACLTPNRDALVAARKAGVQMVVAHHPLIFKPLGSLRLDQPAARLCLDYHDARITVFSAHTNLDVVPGGVSHVLATQLGLGALRPLFPVPQATLLKLVVFVPDSHLDLLRDAVSKAGAGKIGNYSHCTFSAPGEGTFLPGDGAAPYVGAMGQVNREPERRFESIVPKPALAAVLAAMRAVHPYEVPAFDVIPLENANPDIGLGVRGELPGKGLPLEAFAAHVRDRLKARSLRLIAPRKKATVRTVAVLGGSGGGDIARVPADIDCYVTGDVKYHDADLARERGLPVIDAGHVPTELPIVPAIAAYLAQRHPGLKTSTHIEADPFGLLES